MQHLKTKKFQKRGASSSRLQKRKKRVFILKVIMLCAVLGAGGYGFFSMVNAQSFSIATVNIQGTKLVSQTDVARIANNSLAGSYAFFFPKKNVLLAPRDEIKTKLEEAYPEFTNVEVETEGLTKININVAERTPAALWCEGDIKTILDKENATCYFADATGFIFSKAPTYSGNALPTFGGHFDTEKVIGSQILSERDFDIYKEFMKNISVLNTIPAFLHIDGHNEYTIVLTNGGRILISGMTDTLVLFENLKSVIEEQGNSTERQAFLNNLDYIDLRYGNKVYYKLR